jgi:hypothetical protein
MKANGTPIYARQHKRGLTLSQQNAVDLLAAGKTDTETAELLKLSRTCITKWRLYDPVFQAALNVRRAEVWAVGVDRLRSLIPKALNTLAEELENRDSPNRLKAASEILKLAQLSAGSLGIGPTDADEIVLRIVERKRASAHSPLEDLLNDDQGLPPFERHVEQTWHEPEAQLAKVDEGTQES